MKIFTAHGKRIYNINCLGHVFISRQKQTHVGQVILILRVEAAIPHSTGLAICFAHLAFVGSNLSQEKEMQKMVQN